MAYLYRETLAPDEDAEPYGAYETDGAAGIVVNHFGNGRTIYCGALAGMAYLQPAFTESSQILPTEFPRDRRDFITTPARWADIVRPVETSDPLVESQYLTGSNGDVVMLINWRDEPIDELVVRLAAGREIRSIRSLRAAGYFKGHLHEQARGELPIVQRNGAYEVRLPLAISDYLLVN